MHTCIQAGRQWVFPVTMETVKAARVYTERRVQRVTSWLCAPEYVTLRVEDEHRVILRAAGVYVIDLGLYAIASAQEICLTFGCTIECLSWHADLISKDLCLLTRGLILR